MDEEDKKSASWRSGLAYVCDTVVRDEKILLIEAGYGAIRGIFQEITRAASLVELYLGLLNHSTAGLSWLNI